MAQIHPFGGFRYDLSQGADLAALVAPPYDVLSKSEIAALHAASPHNITHLTRPVSYEDAGCLWSAWRNSGVVRGDTPSLYHYTQSFIDPETGLAVAPRTGLVCALTLEEYGDGGVLPHENTIAAHRADRLELMRATHANLESIYGLYADPDGEARRALGQASELPVVGEVQSSLGGSHSLRRIDDPGLIAALQSALSGKTILIADGHHRYETALAYRREHPDEPGAGAILITLTAFEDEGLVVLPTHRLVRGVGSELLADLPKQLRAIGFDIDELSASSPRLAPGTLGFDLVRAGEPTLRSVLRGGADAAIAAMSGGSESDAWKTLDVTVLHKLVLERLLGIPMASLAATDQVRYTRDDAEAREKVATGEFQAAFLLGRPTVEGVQAVSEAGDRMPQKSTFFYPKLLSGLVMRSLL